jgi:hypothetical protein
MSRTRSAPFDLAWKTGELLWAAPQVIGLRLARMALAGHAPGPRDQREFVLMGREKLEAAAESWQAMGMHAMAAAPAALLAAWQALYATWGRAAWSGSAAVWPAADGGPLGRLALELCSRGLAPVRRRAVANAKRLRRG